MYAMVTFTINIPRFCWHQSTVNMDPMGYVFFFSFWGSPMTSWIVSSQPHVMVEAVVPSAKDWTSSATLFTCSGRSARDTAGWVKGLRKTMRCVLCSQEIHISIMVNFVENQNQLQNAFLLDECGPKQAKMGLPSQIEYLSIPNYRKRAHFHNFSQMSMCSVQKLVKRQGPRVCNESVNNFEA